VSQEHERRRKAAFVLVEMVLGDPGGVEAAMLGVDDLLRGEPLPFGRARDVEQAREEAKPRRSHLSHRPLLLSRANVWPARALSRQSSKSGS